VTPTRKDARYISWVRVVVASTVLIGWSVGSAFGADHYALVVTGASGVPEYAPRYDGWRESLVSLLRETWGYPQDRVVVLAEKEAPGVRPATREGVRAALAGLRKRTGPDDVIAIVLIGHGTGVDPADAKFNLVGPDLTAQDWAALIKPIAARVVFVNTTGGSFPFLEALAGPNRIILTATDSPAQQFDTVFPEAFVAAFTDQGADGDKNGRVSIWEAFTFASARVRTWFEQQGRLATERPLLDDSGDGVGRESEPPQSPGSSRIPSAGLAAPAAPPPRAAAPGPGPSGGDGALARVTYLQPDAAVAQTGDTELNRLLTRRAELERDLERIRARKDEMPPDEYEAALEKTLLEIARVDREIRART